MKRARRGKRTETKAAAEKRWEGWDGEHDGAQMESAGKWSGEAGKGVHIAEQEGRRRGAWDARMAPEGRTWRRRRPRRAWRRRRPRRTSRRRRGAGDARMAPEGLRRRTWWRRSSAHGAEDADIAPEVHMSLERRTLRAHGVFMTTPDSRTRVFPYGSA